MKYFPGEFLKSRYLWALGAGLCLAAAFPNIGIAGLGWVAPGLIVICAAGSKGWETFRIGYVAGLSHYLLSLCWLLNIPYRWHGIPLAPALGWLSLAAFLSLFVAGWTWFIAGGAISKLSPPTGGKAFLDKGFLPQTWAGRLGWSLMGAAAWVAVEMTLARIFGGFPWNLLANSQYGLVPLNQIATVTGVYGVSFLMIWLSLSLVCAIAELLRTPNHRARSIAELAPAALAVATVFSIGFRVVQHAPEPERTIRVTLLQPSIPQTLIWDPASDDERFRRLVQLCERALQAKTDLVIWPEAAIPKLLRYDQEIFAAVTGLASKHGVWMIVGADDAEARRETVDPKDADYYNSGFLISPQGELVQKYRKRSLVIFGEYIPLTRWLPFLSWFTPIQGGFTPGEKNVPFEMPDLKARTSVLICFEDIFPQLGREATEEETDFLVNITNNGWFGDAAAQTQHAYAGLYRAIENRRPLIRCTNTGLTCWIDAYGRVRHIFRDEKGSIYGEGYTTFDLPLRAAGPGKPITFYNRHGDWFGLACAVLVAARMIGLVMTRRFRLSH